MHTSTGFRPGLLALGIVAAIAAVLVAVSPARAATHEVSIQGFAFSPAAITVAAGDTVTWTNNDTVSHTASSTIAGSFDSSTLAPGASFSFTFASAGTFTYRCNIHAEMAGSVLVSAPASSATPAPPATGSGIGPGSTGAGSWLLVAGLAAVGLLSAGATALVVTRR